MEIRTNVDKLIDLVLRDADRKELGASQRGAMGDDGASRLREQVKFYNYGRKQEMPVEWADYEAQLDEEYEEYLRLKKKFKNR